MLSVEEAWGRISTLATPLAVETRPLENAAGFVLAEPVRAPIDLPPFDNSAMDGFALRAEDTVGASANQPVRVKVTGEVAAGSWLTVPVARGAAVKIMTGAQMPPGADTVLMLEAGRFRDGVVEIREPLPPGVHVRRHGEDVELHQLLAEAGTRLNAQRLGLLAASGIARLRVHRQVHVSLLATGSELVPAGTPLEPGQIYDSNRIILQRLLARAGVACKDLGVVADDPSRIAERIQAGFDADVLLISGGVSVGAHDHVKTVLQDLGMETIFWRVKMKPGKPLLCGRVGERWIFGLPGNPISCVVGYLVFIEPLLRRLQGEGSAEPHYESARLASAVRKTEARTYFMTAQLARGPSGAWQATPTVQQGSAMMQALAQANAFLVVPEAVMMLESGAQVDVLPFEG